MTIWNSNSEMYQALWHVSRTARAPLCPEEVLIPVEGWLLCPLCFFLPRRGPDIIHVWCDINLCQNFFGNLIYRIWSWMMLLGWFERGLSWRSLGDGRAVPSRGNMHALQVSIDAVCLWGLPFNRSVKISHRVTVSMYRLTLGTHPMFVKTS